MAKNKQQNGFTLVEAVVATAIVAVMSGLVMTGTSGARDKFQVRNAAQQFANDLRETILLTKNGVNVYGCPINKRDCSSYRIVSAEGADTYVRKVTVSGTDYGTKNFTLPGGAKFSSTITASPVFVFPSVVFSGTLPNFAIVSTKDPTNVKSCVSVAGNGVVSVKYSDCL